MRFMLRVLPICLIGLLLPAWDCYAQSPKDSSHPAARIAAPAVTPTPAPTPTPVPAMLRAPKAPENLFTIPFSKLSIVPGDLVLRGSRATYSLTLPLSPRVSVHNILMHVVYTSSISLLDERSQLVFLINGQVLAQVQLHHLTPENQIDILVPDKMLKPGYNSIEFDAAMHYTLKCEDPSGPELWTRINSVDSEFSYQQDLKPITESLASLEDVFDSKLQAPLHINIVTGPTQPTDGQLLNGGIVAQGVAMRMPYSKLFFTQSAAPAPGMDNIYVGTTDQLRSIIPAQTTDKNAFMEMTEGPDSRYLNLIVAGQTEADVTLAAKAFAQLQFPLPDSPFFAVTSQVNGSGQFAIVPDALYQFSDLGFSTMSLKGMHTDAFRLDFNMPPDLYADERSQVMISLHCAYGAAMRSDSVMNVFLNDEFATAIPLNDPLGGSLADYKIYVPLRSFLPGHNRLVIQPQMMPLVTDQCQAIQEENLWDVLYEDSTITIPSASHYTQIPDLHLLACSGFPFASSRATDSFSVYVARPDSGSIGTAWTVLAKLCQKSRQVLIPTSFSTWPARTPGSILAIGGEGSLDPVLVNTAPVRLGTEGSIGSENSKFGQIHGELVAGNRPILTSYVSPFDRNGEVVVLTAGSSEMLLKGVDELVQPEYWEQLKGDTAVWSDTPESLATTSFTTRTSVGTANITTSLGYDFSKYPLIWAGVISVVLLVFVLLSRKLLMKRQKGQH